MNMLGDFRYVSDEHINGLGGVKERHRLFRPGGDFARKIACNSLGIVKIGDWIFVHGGLLPEHVNYMYKDKKNPIENINKLVRDILIGKKRLDSINSEEEDILFGKDGIFWTRKYSHHKISNQSCSLITKTLSLLEIDTNKGGIVVGHTPQNGINSQCNNKIWRVDTGMSEAFGKRSSSQERIEILEILENGDKVNII